MPKERRQRTKYHHASSQKPEPDSLEELGIQFKMPPPKDLPMLGINDQNQITQMADQDDMQSIASSRMSSRSSASRLGRDGDTQVGST